MSPCATAPGWCGGRLPIARFPCAALRLAPRAASASRQARRTHHAIRFRSGPSRLPAGSGERVGVGMEAEPRHALGAGGRQPPAAQSAVQSPDPSPPPLRAAASVAAGASEVSASLRRSRLKQEPAAPLAGRLAPWAGVWPGLGGFRRFGLRPWRGTPAPMLGAAKATPKATRKVVPGDSETSRFRAREYPRRTRARGGKTRPVFAP